MSEVSYQAILAPGPAHARTTYVALGPTSICTRRKEATIPLTVALSKQQKKWLDQVVAESGRGIDRGAVLRALVDLGRELDVDWALLAGGSAMRKAVRDSVRVRRPAEA